MLLQYDLTLTNYICNDPISGITSVNNVKFRVPGVWTSTYEFSGEHNSIHKSRVGEVIMTSFRFLWAQCQQAGGNRDMSRPQRFSHHYI